MTRVCVASSFPEIGNRNQNIVTDLAAGFCSLIGEASVRTVPFPAVADHVLLHRPQLLVLIGSALPSACDYRAIARSCSKVGCTFAFWTVEDPYEFDHSHKFASCADIVFTNDVWALNYYSRSAVHHLPTAASPTLRRPLNSFEDRNLDVFFCGVGFENRRRFIADAASWLASKNTLIVGADWEQLGRFIVNKRLPQEGLAEYYANSRVVLNIGRDHSLANSIYSLPATTPGPRTFEAAMAGCVQVYFQPSAVLNDYFTVGEEILAVDSVAELEAVFDDLSSAPHEYIKIAKRAQSRCLKDHTYRERAQSILGIAQLT